MQKVCRRKCKGLVRQHTDLPPHPNLKSSRFSSVEAQAGTPVPGSRAEAALQAAPGGEEHGADAAAPAGLAGHAGAPAQRAGALAAGQDAGLTRGAAGSLEIWEWHSPIASEMYPNTVPGLKLCKHGQSLSESHVQSCSVYWLSRIRKAAL